MAEQNVLLQDSFKAAVDLTIAGVAGVPALFYLGKQDANGNLVLAAAGTDLIEGTIEEPVPVNAATRINTDGIVKVVYGGTVAINDRLTSDASGRAITTVTAGNYSIGRARVAGAVGDIGEMKIERWKI